jgi:hypothetical protein
MAKQTSSIRQVLSDRNSSNGAASLPRNISEYQALNRETARHMSKCILLLGALCLTAACYAETNPSTKQEGRTAPTWSLAVTGGFTNTFQLILGGTYGAGPDFQNRLTAGVNDVFLKGDTLSTFGWSTTDIPSASPNWQAGLMYKLPLLRRKNHSLALTGSGQRWILPMVGKGTKDWFVIGNLTYGTSVKRIPVFVSGDSYSLVKSNLPTGHALYTQIYTQQPLLNHRGFRLALREGPAYTYSWGLYGASGSRVMRYSGALISSWKGTTLEASYRQQFGLQDKIPNNRYWSFLFTRQFGGAFHHE